MVRLVIMIRLASFTWKPWVGLIFTSGVDYFVYSQLARMAKPEYGENGELLDGGGDLNLGGLTGYLHDIVYITCFVQVLSIVLDYVWFVYLLIPSFAFYKLLGSYKLWGSILYQYFFQGSSSNSEEEDAKAKKKREKLEKKAQRPKFVRR